MWRHTLLLHYNQETFILLRSVLCDVCLHLTEFCTTLIIRLVFKCLGHIGFTSSALKYGRNTLIPLLLQINVVPFSEIFLNFHQTTLWQKSQDQNTVSTLSAILEISYFSPIFLHRSALITLFLVILRNYRR